MRIDPVSKIRGEIILPGDKSISHRVAMLGAIAQGDTHIENFSTAIDCQSTLNCLRKLGVPVEQHSTTVIISGRARDMFRESREMLDAGNSGSTLRMLAGILAGQPFSTTLTGDESLQRRPMKRIIDPLVQMGASIEARAQNFAPLIIRGGLLSSLRYTLPVPSAQVKTTILFAGLYADGDTTVVEPQPTRDHTEILFPQFGVPLEIANGEISVSGGAMPRGGRFSVAGDSSLAIFWAGAALLLPNSEICLRNVCLNPTRTAWIGLLQRWGADIQIATKGAQSGESRGDVIVKSSTLRGGEIDTHEVPLLIDELPMIVVLAARSEQGLRLHGAKELRVKESDRLHSLAVNLAAQGVRTEEREDGLMVEGCQRFRGGKIQTFGDHRIAMAMSVAALAANSFSMLDESHWVNISYPEFFETLRKTVS